MNFISENVKIVFSYEQNGHTKLKGNDHNHLKINEMKIIYDGLNVDRCPSYCHDSS